MSRIDDAMAEAIIRDNLDGVVQGDPDEYRLIGVIATSSGDLRLPRIPDWEKLTIEFDYRLIFDGIVWHIGINEKYKTVAFRRGEE